MIYLEFILNLLVTILIEGLIIFLLFRRWDFVYYTCLCNLLTNPALNLLLLIGVQIFGIRVYVALLIILELASVILEGAILHRLCLFTLKKALAMSFLLNLASFLAGFSYYIFV
jgi:hypothetical protein